MLAAVVILSLVARAVVIVVAKFASSPIAAAISFNVLSTPGAASIRLEIDVST